MVNLDSWDVGKGSTCVYTENPSVAKRLAAEFGQMTVYFRQQQPFAWQVLIPSKILHLFEKSLEENDQ